VELSRLAAIPLLADLTDADLAAIALAAQEVDVEEGETIAIEGEVGHALFAIERGRAAVSANGEPIATLGPGDVFGEIAVIASGRRTATVVATSPMRLIALLKPDVWALERRSPATAERLRALVAERRGRREDPV
jgi:CRP-like cAMP-binding protein